MPNKRGGRVTTLPEFLGVFFPDPEEPIFLRAFGPKGCDDELPEYKAVKLKLSIAELPNHRTDLLKINRTRGLYFVVNAGGDKDADISRFTAAYCEDDSRPIAEQHKRLDACPIPPVIRIETSKSVHAYWPLEPGATEEEWRSIQNRLIFYFGGDDKIKNPSRVMRLPFFNHVSLNHAGLIYKRVGLAEFNPGRRFTVQELLSAFPDEVQNHGETVGPARPAENGGLYRTWDELNAELRRRIASHKTASKRPDGWIHCQGICHGGKSKSAIALNPATGAFQCTGGCETPTLLRAFGLPEKPEGHSIAVGPSNDSAPDIQVDTPDWPIIEPEAFHGLAGEIIHAIEPHTESDPAGLLIQLLIGLGSLIGAGPHSIADGARHGINLFAVLVGQSSRGRKGTSWGQIRQILAGVDEIWTKARVSGGLSSGEGLIWAVRDPIYQFKQGKDDSEPGRLVMTDPGIEDKRLLAFESEFARTLKVMERDQSTLSAIIRDCFDTGNLSVLTKSAPAKSSGAHVSIIGHITKDELGRALAAGDCFNGFANRFLWVCVKRSRLLPEGGNFKIESLDPLITKLRQAVQFARSAGEVRRNDECREIWREIYPDLTTELPGLLGAVTARSEALVLRLSILYALLDYSAEIRPEHLTAALALWQYAEDSARFIFGSASGDSLADRIAQILRQAGRRMSRTEISNALNRNYPSARLDQALKALQAIFKVVVTREENAGHLVEYWSLDSTN
jgi:hypothetical protein